MKNISLSSVLLFALIIPPITKYTLWPDSDPQILYAVIFGGLLINLLFDLMDSKKLIQKAHNFKLAVLLFTLVISLGSVMFTSIVTRHQRAPIFNVHDIILQVEAGMQYLLHGKNPYAESYFGTPLEEWEYREMGNKAINPALYHFVMSPFYLLFHLPFYFISMIYPHYFDARIVLIFLLGMTIYLIIKLLEPGENRLLFITLLTLNPANLNYFIEGRSDFFVFAFLFLSWFLLTKKRYALSGVALALAVGSKQSAWIMIPFFLVYIFLEKRSKITPVFKTLMPGFLTALVIFLPFLFWNFKAFIDSTILYLTGGTAHSYPISGYGFGMLLYQLGVIKDLHANYPFFIWQVLFSLPILVILVLWQKRENTIKKMIISYGITLFVFWYFSRFFNNNHLAYLSMIFICAYIWPSGQKQELEGCHFGSSQS